MVKVACSGLARGNTGIGVVQRKLYPYLIESFGPLRHSPVRDLGRGPKQRIIGLWNGLRPPRDGYDVFLSVVPPLPFGLSGRVVSVVHDLRWLRTRGFVSRAYRMWDLKRTVARSDALICISQRTYEDLVAVLPAAAEKASVAWLGPGLVPDVSLAPRDSGNLLLIGGAAHKENEAAAEMLARIRPPWLRGITGIGVSTEVKAIIEREFGPGFANWMSNVSDQQVVDAYNQAEFFMLLSKDEGFGLPFVEALVAGCQVIAFDQPLTRELLGDACTYVSGNSERDASVLASKPGTSFATRESVVRRFSWDNFGQAVADKLQIPVSARWE